MEECIVGGPESGSGSSPSGVSERVSENRLYFNMARLDTQ